MRHGGRGGNRLRRLAAWAAGVAVLGLTGCSSGGGLAIISGNFWGNGGSRLIEPARAIRDATPPPPGAPRELAKAVLPPYLVEPGDVLLVTLPSNPTRPPSPTAVHPKFAGSVNVRIVARVSKVFYVLGEVNTPAADSCRVVLPVCYRQIVQLGDTTTNYQLQPGDRVFVPTRGFFESLCPDKKGKQGQCALRFKPGKAQAEV
jgi:polysaccharide export outer membrane protein